MIRGVHHVAVHTPDLDRAVAFYTGLLGFVEVPEASTAWSDHPGVDRATGLTGSAGRMAMLRAANAYLEVFEYSSPRCGPAGPLHCYEDGFTHICLAVDDVDAEFSRLAAQGVVFTSEPVDFGEVRAVYGHDPDGNIVELIETVAEHCFAFDRLTAPASTPRRGGAG